MRRLDAATEDRWLAVVLADFPSFLQDHASCERKASGMALSLAAHYPDRPALLESMANLAVEELGHYRDVIRLLIDHGIAPAPDTRDLYVNRLEYAGSPYAFHTVGSCLAMDATSERPTLGLTPSEP